MGLTAPLFVALALQNSPVSLRVEERVGRIDGRFRFDEAPAHGDSIDLREDFGLDQAFFTTALFAGWRSGELALGAEVSHSRAEGSQAPDATLRWNESLLPAGEELDVDLRRTGLHVEARHGLATFDALRLDAGLRLAYDRRVLTIDSPSQGRDDDTLSSLSPELLVGAAWTFDPRWSLTADLSGFAFSVDDYSSRTLRGILGLAWSWTETWALRAGLRGEIEHIVSSDSIQRNAADLRQADLYLGIEARF